MGLGGIQAGSFHVFERYKSVHRCQGKGCVALSTSLKHTHLEGFPPSRRPGRGGCHPWPTNQQMMCGGNSMESHQPWKTDHSCILYVTVIPGFWGFRIRPSTSPSSAFISHCAKILKCLVCKKHLIAQSRAGWFPFSQHAASSLLSLNSDLSAIFYYYFHYSVFEGDLQ